MMNVNFHPAGGQELHVGNEPCDADVIRSSFAEPEEFVSLFERHFDAIHGYLARRAGRDAGSELTSEVFATAFAQRSRYDLARPDAAPWLYGIAANLLHRRRRTEARQLRAYARTGIDHASTSDPAERPDPALAAALGALKPADRETLLLFAWADLDYEQIAEALQIPVGTVRSRLNRARRQLRAALADGPALRPEEAING
jgi:RNA polymerase sigma factor (sigma-70 family)